MKVLAAKALASAYARAVLWRREWYARRPEARRRLARPVISVGNVAAGGSGKTPVVAALARWLLAAGHRPSILSRGYARKQSADGVLVVSDGRAVREPAARSGDEPQMLARALAGVPVLVGADRFLAGRIAERRLGCTVHILDDGFQHLQLHRDVDLVLLSAADLDDEVIPAGRLREPVAAAARADALLLNGAFGGEAASEDRVRPLGVPHTFRVAAELGAARLVAPFGEPMPHTPGAPVVAVAGIARPERFFRAARAQGWNVVEELAFHDHHWFGARDRERMHAVARAAGASVILTTEKDAMRLLDVARASVGVTMAYLPLTVTIEPADAFRDWLLARLAGAAGARPVETRSTSSDRARADAQAGAGTHAS